MLIYKLYDVGNIERIVLLPDPLEANVVWYTPYSVNIVCSLDNNPRPVLRRGESPVRILGVMPLEIDESAICTGVIST